MAAATKATKATKTARPRKTGAVVVQTARGPVRQVVDGDDLPAELRDMYGPPKLSKARGGGTVAAVDDGDDLNFDTSTPAPEIPMERLFAIDGVPYYVPVEYPPSYAIVYLDGLEEGRDIAVARVLKLAVGEGWKALRDLAERRPDLISPEQFSKLMNKVLTKVMGVVEEAGEGN
jgi:hypothetical protein